MYKYNLKLIARADLLTGIDSSETQLEVYPGQGTNFIPTPCIAVLSEDETESNLEDAEHVVLTSRVGDVYQVRRGIIGSSAWEAGAKILGYWSPEHIYQLQRHLDQIEWLLNLSLGRHEQYMVFQQPGYDFDLSIVSGMEVQLEAGACFSNYLIFSKNTVTNLTHNTVTADTRYDIIQANPNTGELEIVEGIEGGGVPSASPNSYALWQAEITLGMTEIALEDYTDLRSN